MKIESTRYHILETNPAFDFLDLDPGAAGELLLDCCRRFADLPLYHAGQSKEIRRTGKNGILVQRFLPTIYSYTSNRAGIIPGTDRIRMAISQIFWEKLHRAGIRSCLLAVCDEFALITEEQVPPVEVIVKAALIGTPAHLYDDLFTLKDRFGKPFVKGEEHPPYCRFDYRNPLTDSAGNRLRDEQLPTALASRFIDTVRAEQTVLEIFHLICETSRAAGFDILDCCLFMDESGTILCGEISPDNMRVKRLSPGRQQDCDYDKDLWRKGRTAEEIRYRWLSFQEALEES